jgi:hypothetical protein
LLLDVSKRMKGASTMSDTIQGEGNYDAARRYRRRLRKDLKEDLDVEASAKKARQAVEGEDGDLLAQAEKKGKAPMRGED